ncbi:hypothetical protein [Acinetobacter larvae]|uniref:Uncharacterized protein n=1 Tax=Acinetobacter larvae TaxID=1789224 RepID=A0A1B2LXT5_9GAMM|nr:hypothetical protein [Acinetobacter larvae]AOA57573.1 hypothetical protein BFG52_03865 [Acinetobacter larvae]
MSEIIKPDNTELLQQIFGDIQQQSYIDVVRDVQQQIQDNAELIDVPVVNHFAPGVYMRQMDAVAGTLVVSKMHRTEHMNILIKGSITVATENGIEFLQAPVVLKSMPGTKRIGYFHEDSSWITVHPTEETDLEKIEQQVIVPDSEIDQFLASLPQKVKEFE